MANVTTNPMGVQCVFDGANPRIITAKARQVISGGYFVQFSGAAAGAVGSSIANFASANLECCIMDNPHQCNGIALQNIASGAYGTIATRGAFLLRAGNAVSGGAAVVPTATGDCVNSVGYGTTGSIMPIGRAMSNGGSEAFVLVNLSC